MRHVVVTRLAAMMGALLIVVAGLFAWAVRDHEPASAPAAPAVSPSSAFALPQGRPAFERYCATCHDATDLRARASAQPREDLERFLRDHGDAPDADDQAILDYLTAPASR